MALYRPDVISGTLIHQSACSLDALLQGSCSLLPLTLTPTASNKLMVSAGVSEELYAFVLFVHYSSVPRDCVLQSQAAICVQAIMREYASLSKAMSQLP